MSQELRPYQQAAIDELEACWAKGFRRPLLVMPTGAGKTTVASHIIRHAAGRVAFVAHRRELIGQAWDRLQEHYIDAGIEMASDTRRDPRLRVQVASVQTLARRHLAASPDLLVIDEAHRSAAASYRALINRHPDARLVGLTATPYRLDGKALGDVYDTIIRGPSPGELEEEGFLVPFTVFAPFRPNVESVRIRGGDFDPEQLAERMDPGLKDIVRWASVTGRTAIYCPTIDYSVRLTALLQEQGLKAEHIDGETPVHLRDAILKDRFQTGETAIISSVNVLTEGYDCPAIQTIICARPTASLALYQQMVGRASRPAPGKRYALLIDFAANVIRFGFPHEDRRAIYSLTGKLSREPNRLSLTTCPSCFAVYLSSRPKCPACGEFKPEPKPRQRFFSPEDSGASVIELTPERRELARDVLRRKYDALEAKARQTRKGPYWATWIFKRQYGFTPDPEWRSRWHR